MTEKGILSFILKEMCRKIKLSDSSNENKRLLWRFQITNHKRKWLRFTSSFKKVSNPHQFFI